MSSSRQIVTLAGRAVVACLLFGATMVTQYSSAETIFFDDFNDGDAEDGSPVAWTPYSGTWDSSSGDYVATGPIPRVALAADHDLHGTSTRAQVAVDGNIGASLAVRRPSALSGYAGQILPEGSGGLVAIVRVDGAPIPTILGTAAVPFNPMDNDVMIQLDAFGDELSLWAWPVGESMPGEPALQVVDDTYANGAVGLIAARAGGDPNASATFRFIRVADAHIPEPSTVLQALIGAFGLIALSMRRALLQS